MQIRLLNLHFCWRFTNICILFIGLGDFVNHIQSPAGMSKVHDRHVLGWKLSCQGHNCYVNGSRPLACLTDTERATSSLRQTQFFPVPQNWQEHSQSCIVYHTIFLYCIYRSVFKNRVMTLSWDHSSHVLSQCLSTIMWWKHHRIALTRLQQPSRAVMFSSQDLSSHVSSQCLSTIGR